MKICLILVSLMLVAGCGRCQRVWTSYTGDLTYKCAKTGIEYVQSDSGIAVLLDQDGAPVPCEL